ncbi:receptor-type tyrosine-protein phosphatase eta [Colossoma macropomum]|uniref:receptor-type tyrosine-protein phosphatase eta n=1 Tax=Colossoma macropomum TaxID=42526 RepID=UPI0018643222|nr:receptor-type tyrosine-protein phosphatase eta [Colossoma macropomum]
MVQHFKGTLVHIAGLVLFVHFVLVDYGQSTCSSCGYKASSSATEITILIANGLSCSVQNASIQKTNSSVVVGNLMPGYTYPLEINCSTICCSSFSTYPATVDNITVLDQNSSSVWVAWLAPLGHVDSYELNIYSVALNRNFSELSNQSQIQQLLAGYIYNLTITSVSGGLRNTSSVFQLATKPNPPSTISVNGQTNVSISIFWGVPVSMDGLNVYYEVSYKSSQSSTNTSLTNSTSIQLTALSPGNQYTIAISTIGALGLKSSSISITAYTTPNAVQNLQASPVNTSSVNLVWSPLPGNSGLLSYKIQINGAFFNTSNFSLLLTQLQPGTAYNCSVTALITAANLYGPPQYTLCITKPKAVASLNATSTSTTEMHLSWTPQDENLSYLYELSMNGAVMGFYRIETAIASNLTPGTNYTFTVVTILNNLRSDPVQISAFTGLDKASNISAVGTSVSMRVEWSGPAGSVSLYTITLLLNGIILQTQNQTDATPVVFSNLFPGTLYTVTLGITSGPVRVNSGSVQNATLPSPPGVIMLTQQTRNTLSISWAQPLNMNSADYRFRVLYQCNCSNSSCTSVKTLNESSSKNSSTITGLSAGSPYIITVQTVGALGYLSSSQQIFVYTCPSSVSSVNVDSFSEHSIFLSWQQSDTLSSVYSYLLAVRSPNGTYILQLCVGNTTAQLQPLPSASLYNISIITQTADGTQSSAMSITAFTKPLQVVSLEAKLLNVTAVWLNWKRPLEFHDGFSYHVQISNCTEPSRSLLVTSENTTFTNLQPGTLCLFSVYSCSYGIEGQPVSISLYTKPFAVIPIMSNNGSNSSLVVTWTPPVGHVGQYLLNISSEDLNRSELLNNTEHTYTFAQLAAATVYTLTFVTISGPFEEASQPITMATYPNKPGGVEVSSKTTDSLLLRWTAAQGMRPGSFNYSLTYQPDPNFTTYTTAYNTLLLTSLLSGTSYNISLTTIGPWRFQSEAVIIYSITTRPEPVKNLRVISTLSDSLSVAWTGPRGGYVYEVCLKNVSMRNTSLEQMTLNSLTPGTLYNISVQSATSDGTKGEMQLLQTCTDAAAVDNVSCWAPDLTSAILNLTWSHPLGCYIGFQIQLSTPTSYMTATTTDLHYMFTGLQYNTYYSATLWTMGCGKKSQAKELSCTTGITNPPVPNVDTAVAVAYEEYNKFSLIVQREIFNNSNGPVLCYGFLITSDTSVSVNSRSQSDQYLTQTYENYQAGQTRTYLAVVHDNVGMSTEGAQLIVVIGDGTQWNGYRNGPLSPKGSYSFAVVIFTHLVVQNGLVVVSQSYYSISYFRQNFIILPENPVLITGAVGGAIGAVVLLLIVIITVVMLRRKQSKVDSPGVPIHSIRAKVSQPIRVEEYEAHYRKQRADSFCGFVAEFEDLKLVGVNQTKNSALAPENRAKNRYNNVLPYDTSRVKLSVLGSSFDDYINASYMPGHTSRKEFIAAQGPLPCTVNDFWRMIWEKNIHTLVMLTRCNEQGRVKCEEYWPSESKHFSSLTVTTTSEIILEDWTIRDFHVKNVKTAETRSVRQFHFTAWPDHGVPETTELLINFRHLVREHMDQFSRHSPTLVHCSAGVGRTGTFIAIDRLIFQIERDGVVDVYGIIHDLRMHRPLMVQTEDQYVFLNQCAVDIIRSRIGTNVDLIYQNTAALTIYENFEPMNKSKNGYHKA